MRFRYINRLFLGALAAVTSLCALLTQPIFAAEQRRILEEVTVTAQRQEESLQEVPIAVTAFTGETLEKKGIVTPSDLQMSAPNVSFTSTNFGGSSFSIRGIGRLVISGSGESGVSTHLNEIAVNTNLNAIEFFDVERVEVLRGPQGTLFGRNATGGSINVVTKLPEMQMLDGFIDFEAGDYSNQRVKGAINVPLGDRVAFRLAGFSLERDGYTTNLAAGRTDANGNTLPGIDDDIDGRDIVAYRAGVKWDITDNADVWLQYHYFDEDDDRARLTNQICKKNDLPTDGCVPDEFGFDTPHLGSTTGGIFFGNTATGPGGTGALPLGAKGIQGQNGVNFAFPQPEGMGFRDVHTDLEPIYQYEEKLWTVGASYDLNEFTFGVIGAYQETDFLSQMDYLLDVGADLGPSPAEFGFGGGWPTSAPNGRAGEDVIPVGPCNYYDGTAGIFGGCIMPVDQTRVFAFDQSSSVSEYWTVEAKVSSAFSGPFNFQLGASTFESQGYGDYYVNANSLDALGLVGSPPLGFPPLYPTMFNVPANPFDQPGTEGWAAFGEMYFDLTDRMKLTFGLRYNKDEKRANDANAFLASVNQEALLNDLLVPAIEAAFGAPPGSFTGDDLAAFGLIDPNWEQNLAQLPQGMFARTTNLLIAPTFGALNESDIAVLDFFGIPQSEIDAVAPTLPFSAERVALANRVPLISGFNETRVLTGSPQFAEWSAVTGRLGIDWQITDDVMLYAFLSRGYKPGGFNPPIAPEFQGTSSFTFDEEEINSLELGAKSVLFDSQLMLNGAVFIYDYSGLQVTRIKNNSSLNENIDADIMGLELEFQWQPLDTPQFSMDGSISWLDTEVADGVLSVDPLNRSAGDPNYILLKNIDPGALTGTNYVAFLPDITPELIDAALFPAPGSPPGALSGANGGSVPGTTYDNGVPAYFSRNFLDANGVEVTEGRPTNLGGKELPNAPDSTIRLGLQYTWPIDMLAGDLTLRWDYYRQGDMWGREFNAPGDKIDGWDQHNMSLIYQSTNGNWHGRLFARNLQNEDNVTGHYLTSDTSGYFRNYFLTEPRIYGLSVRYHFTNP